MPSLSGIGDIATGLYYPNSLFSRSCVTMIKKPYYAYKFAPDYMNHFIDIDAPKLDSIVGVFHKTKSIVLFLGDISIAEQQIHKHFKQAEIMTMRLFSKSDGYHNYKKIGLIDIDTDYKLEIL